MTDNKYAQTATMVREGYEAKAGLEALAQKKKNMQLKGHVHEIIIHRFVGVGVRNTHNRIADFKHIRVFYLLYIGPHSIFHWERTVDSHVTDVNQRGEQIAMA